MNRIDATFARRAAEKRKVLVGYVTAGFPDKEATRVLLPALAEAGVDVIEIGIPFSDPIADGPTIQEASVAALANGASLPWALDEVARLRAEVSTPLVFMSYSNPLYKMGVTRFLKAAKISGVDGLIVPDLIPEEGELFETASAAQSIDLIYLTAPTSPPERIARIARRTRGFLYAVSLAGVTGMRDRLPAGLPGFLRLAKRLSPVPVAVGFGISTPDHVRLVAPHVDGVIVGSALIRAVKNSRAQGYRGAVELMRSLRQALDDSGEPRKDPAYAAQ